jgi:hypothetical protein
MKIVYIILGLLLLAFVIYMLSGKSRTTLPSISITASGNLPRGPIRTNISDESFTQLHAKLKTGLTTQQVRQEDG